MISWRILINGKLSPIENMAIDEAIMLGLEKGVSEPTIRFYDWNPPTVSFGFHQDVEKEADLERINLKGYGLIRRPTGGRLVLHKNEITYAVIAPLSDHLDGSVIDVYAEISYALADGLKGMGIDVEFEKGTLTSQEQRETSNPCFTSSSRYELTYLRKKIVGSAQVRRNNLFLQHGSILLDQNQEEVADLLPDLTDEQRLKLAQYLKKKTIAINEIREVPVSFNDAVTFLIAGFKNIWHEDAFQEVHFLNTYEQEIVNNLITEKYGKEQWTYQHGKKGHQ
jgi:lipoyl(octanoyl) transferase